MITTIRGILWPLFLGAALAGCGGGSGSDQTSTPSISLLSSRPETVTDGSALVEVRVPHNDQLARTKVMIGGADVTTQFRSTGSGAMVGLVSGLQPGRNNISAEVDGSTGSLSVINSSNSGPVFSGLQQTPWLCTTDRFTLPDGSNLGAPTDASCNAPTKVLIMYMPVGSTTFKVLPATGKMPNDMSQTTTIDGRTVDYIVRLETGTVNRGIYQIAVLFDPLKDKLPNPGGGFSGWNGKVIYSYGGGVGAGYQQGLFTGGVMVDFMLKHGFAILSSTLNVAVNYSNDVTSAETTSMVKEIFIKQFGKPLYTMGWGGSGGAYQQYLIANNYPGLLDGINPSLSFPDLFSIVLPGQDCSLLDRAFAGSSQIWTADQKDAVAGFASWRNCNSGAGTTFASDWMNSYNTLAARLSVPLALGGFPNCFTTVPPFGTVIPSSMIYHPISNPEGIRCSIYDAARTLLGINPTTGFARRPWDNVGVQYGLGALDQRKISMEQFIQLNELAGGYDGDGNLQAARSAAAPDVLNAVYAYGRVNAMQNLSSIPIIDFRAYSDNDPNIHDYVRSFVARARLVRSTGAAGNHVIWTATKIAPAAAPQPSPQILDQVLTRMDQWLTAIKTDPSPGAAAERVLRNRPASLTDGCFAPNSNQFIAEELSVKNGGRCGTLYPAHSDPRMIAGAPLTADVLKCQLKPLQRSGYVGITDGQFARLEAVFPDGVCDYSKASVGTVPTAGPWLKYTAPGVASPL